MLQIKRVSVESGKETWYLLAAAEQMYRLAEIYCEFDKAGHSVRIDAFMADNCPQYRDVLDYFTERIIPEDYSHMTRVHYRGLEVAGWSSAETPEDEGEPNADTVKSAILAVLAKAVR